ncbi:MAG: aminotransferase class I/II-fold pyridoxal phosphate-dependent enzyme [Desulfitobacteriaceae bacterium]
MSYEMDHDFVSIGEVLTFLKKENITNFEKRAELIHDFIDKENKSIGYAFDRYLENGPATSMNVVEEHSGAKKECILWCVNHYLSLNRNSNVIEKACNALRQFGTGCGTSASSCGMTFLHKEIERRVAKLIGKEKAVLFPTGFTANLGSISYIVGSKDLVIFDRECHSSIINGIKLSQAKKWISFKHNNLADLEKKLQKHENLYENIFVIVESAYSMSGDLSPLREIADLKKSYKFCLYVDEAHTFGIYGEKGQGYCYAQGVIDKVDFIISTLSKATASIGGFFAADAKYCSLLKWTDPYVFQACLTPADAAVILASLDEIENNPLLIKELHNKNQYMRNLLISKRFNLGESKSPIIPIFIEDHNKLRMVVNELYEEGIYSTPVVFPAVKVNEGRIRLILNYNHTKEQIDYTVEVLERVCKKYQIIEEYVFKDYKGIDNLAV